MTEQELIVISEVTALQAFTNDDGLEPYIHQVKVLVDEFEHDLSTAAGRARTASLARKVASLKVRFDTFGKDLNEDAMKRVNLINANRKRMREQLDELKAEARKPLTEWEDHEKERIDSHNAIIVYLVRLGLVDVDGVLKDINTLRGDLKALQAYVVDDQLEEFQEKAQQEKENGINRLKVAIMEEEKRIEVELKAERERVEAEKKAEAERLAEQKRIENERIEQAKKEAAEAERKKAEETARLEAERVAKEKAEAAKRLKRAEEEKQAAIRAEIEAEERAKIQAKLAEERRLSDIKAAKVAAEAEQKAKEAAEQAEIERREANKRHVGKIRREAKESLMLFVDEASAKQIVLAISGGKIKHVNINY